MTATAAETEVMTYREALRLALRQELAGLERDLIERVEAAVAYATADEAPPVAELAAGMYAPGSAEQFERMRPGSPFGELDLVFNAGLGR